MTLFVYKIQVNVIWNVSLKFYNTIVTQKVCLSHPLYEKKTHFKRENGIMQKLWPRNKLEKQYIFNYRYYIKLNITFSTSHTFNSDSSIQIHEFRHIKRCEDDIMKIIFYSTYSKPISRLKTSDGKSGFHWTKSNLQ